MRLSSFLIHLSIHLSIYLSIHPSVYLSICLSVSPSLRPSLCLALCLSIERSIHQSICLCVYLSICLSICPSICLSFPYLILLSLIMPCPTFSNCPIYPSHPILFSLNLSHSIIPSYPTLSYSWLLMLSCPVLSFSFICFASSIASNLFLLFIFIIILPRFLIPLLTFVFFSYEMQPSEDYFLAKIKMYPQSTIQIQARKEKHEEMSQLEPHIQAAIDVLDAGSSLLCTVGAPSSLCKYSSHQVYSQ